MTQVSESAEFELDRSTDRGPLLTVANRAERSDMVDMFFNAWLISDGQFSNRIM